MRKPGCCWDEFGKNTSVNEEKKRKPLFFQVGGQGGLTSETVGQSFPQQDEENSHLLGRKDSEMGNVRHRGGNGEETNVGGS